MLFMCEDNGKSFQICKYSKSATHIAVQKLNSFLKLNSNEISNCNNF